MLDVSKIRNVAFVGHGAVGKTTLADALLHAAGAVGRAGSVTDGSSVFDFDDDEKQQKHSIDSALAYCDALGHRFHFLDCPGYPDYLGQALAALNSVEIAAIVIDAHRGIEANTRRMFEESHRLGLAQIIVLTKLDHDGIDLPALVANIQETFGPQCTLMELPIGLGPNLSGVVNLIDPVDGVSGDVIGDAESARTTLVERVVETDDAMMESYFGGEVPSHQALAAQLEKAVVQETIVPILCTSAVKGVGLRELLEVLIEDCPSPVDGRMPPANDAENQPVSLAADPDKPFVGRVFKTLSDKFGHQTFVRVYQGRLQPNSNLCDHRTQTAHRFGTFHLVQGKNHEKVESVGPGEFLCVTKVDGVQLGDTLTADGQLQLEPMRFPAPMFPLAVEAEKRGDDAKVVQALRRVAAEDPCFRVERTEETNETVMHGLSQLHLETIVRRLQHRDGVHLITHEPKVPYRETITKAGEGHHRHKKQSGGRGQFAEVFLRVRPLERGAGFNFVNNIFGGAISGSYVAAVEKGVREAMHAGCLAGHEVVDVEVEVYDGKEHTVDSSEAAFKIAAANAFREACRSAAPVLLEPIVKLEAVVPPAAMGDITSDLNTRRAHITGMDVLPGGLQVVRAEAPLATVLRYQNELKSMTGGQGTFSMESSHLAILPPQLQQRLVAEHEATAAAAHG